MTLTFDKRDADKPPPTAEQVREVRVALLTDLHVSMDEDDLKYLARAMHGYDWPGYTPEERAETAARYRAHWDATLPR